MSFREKRAWIGLVSLLAVYGGYFLLWGGGATSFIVQLAATVAILIAVQMTLLVGAAVAAPEDARAPLDERDRRIDLGAGRAGFFALQAGLFGALAAAGLGAAPAFTARLLLAVMVAGELARYGWQALAYRRGAA